MANEEFAEKVEALFDKFGIGEEEGKYFAKTAHPTIIQIFMGFAVGVIKQLAEDRNENDLRYRHSILFSKKIKKSGILEEWRK